MGDIYLVRFGNGDDGEPSPRELEQARLRERYARHLEGALAMDATTAELVVATLFAPLDREGRLCSCSCHPQLSSHHDDGFDCPCTWDLERRATEHEKLFSALDSPEMEKWRSALEDEHEVATRWAAAQDGVEAELVTSFAPEQWRGSVEGRSFYFRERHGIWRIELDLEETGALAERVTGTDESGEITTAPVRVTEGRVIAEGTDSELGESVVDHLAFIVRTIRDHLVAERSAHEGALFFCPMCGSRMKGPA